MKETKVVCPKCGTEMKIAEREYATAGVVIGKDSGLGTVVLQAAEESTPLTKAQKRVEALKAAGVDTSTLFAMQTGSVARLQGGVIEVIPDNDPIFDAILKGSTIPDRRLFRRWVMAQMFHMMNSSIGYTAKLHQKGYEYQWKVINDELWRQVRLHHNDLENYRDRNRWFNREMVIAACESYMKHLTKYIERLKVKKCKGVPYKTVGKKHVFVNDIPKKVYAPISHSIAEIRASTTPLKLYNAFRSFKQVYVAIGDGTQFLEPVFVDAYKGSGAYFTMKNMILFHGCKFKLSDKPHSGYMSQEQSLAYMNQKANEYHLEGWRLFGVMKQLIEDSGISISCKINSWKKK